MIRYIISFLLVAFLLCAASNPAFSQEDAPTSPTQAPDPRLAAVSSLPEFYAESPYYALAIDYLNDDSMFGQPSTELVYARIAKMIRMGYIQQAHDLFTILDADVMSDAKAARTSLTLKFLHLKTAEACLDIQAMVQNFEMASWWQDLKLFCDSYYSPDTAVSTQSNDTPADAVDDPQSAAAESEPQSFIYYTAANTILDTESDLRDIGAYNPMEIGLLFAAKRFDTSALSATLAQWPVEEIPGLILAVSVATPGMECLLPETVYRAITTRDAALEKLENASDIQPDCLPHWMSDTPATTWNQAIDSLTLSPESPLPLILESDDTREGSNALSDLYWPLRVYQEEEDAKSESYIQWHDDHFVQLFGLAQKDPLFLVNTVKHKPNISFSQEGQKQIYDKFLTLTFYEKHVIPSIGLTDSLSQVIEKKQTGAAVHRVLASFGQVKTNKLDPSSLTILLDGLRNLGLNQAAHTIGLTALRT